MSLRWTFQFTAIFVWQCPSGNHLPTHMMLFAFVGTVFAQHFYATNPAASFKHMFAGLLCPRSGLFVSFIPHLVSECSWLFCFKKSANLFYIFSSKSTYIFLVNQPRKLMGYRNQGGSWGFSHQFCDRIESGPARPGHWDRGPLAGTIRYPWPGKSRVLEWEPLTASKQHDIPIYSVWQSPEMVVFLASRMVVYGSWMISTYIYFRFPGF